MATFQDLYLLISREFLIAFRNRYEALNPILFFVLVCLLFPIGIGHFPELLISIAPGIIWASILLATLMSLESLFRTEFDDGTLELMVLANHPFVMLVMIKLLAHWVITIFPLIMLSPIIASAFGLSFDVQCMLLLTLLLGTPVLLLVGSIVATLTLVIPQNGGMLLALLVLPLYVPVLIFGTSAVNATVAGFSAAGPLYMLATMFILSLTLSPFAIVAALKTGVSQ
ncbi:MAG: heme exporter protein CcmB [Methylophagaceae bacterium]